MSDIQRYTAYHMGENNGDVCPNDVVFYVDYEALRLRAEVAERALEIAMRSIGISINEYESFAGALKRHCGYVLAEAARQLASEKEKA